MPLGYSENLQRYGRWEISTITSGAPSRATLCGWLRTIRRNDGNRIALAFRDKLIWLGTYPVQGGGRWINRYGDKS